MKTRSPKPPTTSAYKQLVIKRAALIRELSGLTQAQMAEHLGVSTTRYAKWESTTPMPPRFWQTFCYHAGFDWTRLLTPPESSQREADAGANPEPARKLA